MALFLRLLVVLGAFLPLSGAAQTVIVSDIDDTLKISYVRNKVVSAVRAFDTTSEFAGMATAYRHVVGETSAPIYYVSNASPRLMAESHANFLKNNSFPSGPLLLREGAKEESKITHIRKIIAKENPTTLILIGDNGEHDISVYDRVRAENPGIKLHVFIRAVYSRAKYKDLETIREGQKTFVGPSEILSGLAAEGVLRNEPAQRLAELHRVLFAAEKPASGLGRAYRMDWMDLSEFVPEPSTVPETPATKDYLRAIDSLSPARAPCAAVFH